MNEEVIEDRQQ